MKKSWMLKAVAGIFVTYGIVGFFGVPYAIKNIVPQKISDATHGGVFRVESASFNPFTFRLSLHKFTFKTPQNSDFVAVDFLTVNVNPIDYVWKWGWVIQEVIIEKPQITLHKDAQGEMNIGWLRTPDGDKNESSEASKPLALLINNFTLKEGGIDFTDESEGKHYRQAIDSIGFHLENIDLRDASNKRGVMRLYATINEGGFIDLRGKIEQLKPFELRGSIAFDSGKLYTPWRYFKEKLPIEVADGTVNFGCDYLLNGEDINATKLSRLHVGLEKLRIIPKDGKKTLLGLESLTISEANVWPLRKIVEANRVMLKGLSANAIRSRSGVIDWADYLDQIKKAFPEDENETKIPWQVAIKEAALENMGIGWRDEAPFAPYTASISGINLYTYALSSDPKTLLKSTVHSGALEVQRLGDVIPVAGFKKLDVDEILVDREAKHASVGNITIEGSHFALKRLKDGSIDVQKLLYVSANKTPKSQEAPWSYVLHDIALNDAGVNITDEVPARPVTANMDQLAIHINGISSDHTAPIRADGSGRINQKTTFTVHSLTTREALKSKGDFELNHFSLPLIDPYLEASTNAALRRGDLSLKGTYVYTPTKMSVEGRIALSDWVVEDRRDTSVILGWNRIGVTPFAYAYPDNRLKINQLSVNGLYTNALVDHNKTLNYSTLSKAKKGETNTTRAKNSHPFGIDVVKLAVLNSSATFSDLSLPLPFKTYIHDLNGEILGISTTKDVTTFVRLRGGVDQYGLAKIDGSLNTNAPKSFTDMHVAFDNLELKQYTPYSLQFLGYKIANGKLFLNLGYKINGGKLDAQNKVIIKQIELGEEKAGGSPWPMRLVVALLEDTQGIIDIDLPIQGDVNSPDFKYGKVVWQVIGNLLTKAVTSPFRLLGSLMGISSEDSALSSISFEAGESALTPPMKERLDKLAAVLTKRPKLSLNVHGAWASVEDERALKIQKLIRSVMGSDPKNGIDSTDAMSLEMLERTAKKSLENSELKSMRKGLEEKYSQEAQFVQHYTQALIERLIPMQIVTSAELSALADDRANAVMAYLKKDSALAERIHVSASEKVAADTQKEVPARLEIAVK